jgi:hypothetical protein
MAPPQRYPKPHKQLGRLMVMGRRRGLSFEQWWDEAVRPGKRVVMTNDADPPAGAVLWPSDRNDRIEWRAAILDAEEGWRRAYERAPRTSSDDALVVLACDLGLADDLDGFMAGIEGEADRPDEAAELAELAELMAAA